MRALLLTLAVVLSAAPPTEMKAAETFFSGSVVAVSTTEITVRRRALISDATTKTFAIDAETKIEGRVRVKASVTIQYVTGDEGQARAIRIIVR